MRRIAYLSASLLLWMGLLASSMACTASQTGAPEATAPAAPGTPVAGQWDDISGYLDNLVAQKQIAGAVAMVWHQNEAKYFEAFGMRDVEAAAAMTKDTIFRICSMTKPVTSVAVMMLVEEGKIALDDPLSKFLPAFKSMKVAVPNQAGTPPYTLVDATRQITIRDLLTHLSGLVYTFLGPPYLVQMYRDARISDGLSEAPGTMGDNVSRLAALPLVQQPGAAWNYGLSTDVLGHVVEVVSGQTLAEFFGERIFTPLEMNDTGFRIAPADEARLATVYQPQLASDKKTIEPLPAGTLEQYGAIYSASYPFDRDSMFFSGGAGLVSTVSDYARFARMLLNGGELDGVRLLQSETVALMTRDHTGTVEVAIQTAGDGFGLGFGVVTEAGTDLGLGAAGTFSWAGFYHTYFWVDPQNQLIGVIMSQLFPWAHVGMLDGFREKTYTALAN